MENKPVDKDPKIKKQLKQLSKNQLIQLCLKLSQALEVHVSINNKLKEELDKKSKEVAD